MNTKNKWKLLDLNCDRQNRFDPYSAPEEPLDTSSCPANTVLHDGTPLSPANTALHDGTPFSPANAASQGCTPPFSANTTAHTDTEPRSSSTYLIARADSEDAQKELLYQILGPVFFGQKQAGNLSELTALFRQKYGIDVGNDFLEGDEHYEEYQEAQQALAEGMSIYGGSISFDNCVLAELADVIWDNMEQMEKTRFRRINTLLEE